MALPWSCPGGHRLEGEFDKYREWRADYINQHPEYAAEWGRPTPETAARIWDLVAPHMRVDVRGLVHLPGTRKMSQDEFDQLELQAKQALAVAILTALAAGEGAHQLTKNALFDTLGERWSIDYRAARSREPIRSWSMLPTTLKPIWHEIQLLGIELEGLYQAVKRGCPGLYDVRPIDRHGLAVQTEWAAPLRTELDAIMDSDAEYRDVARYIRVWIDGRGDALVPDDDPFDQEDLASLAIANLDAIGNYGARYAAEWKYNVVYAGPESQRTIDGLEQVRLGLNVDDLPPAGRLEADRRLFGNPRQAWTQPA